MLYYICASLTIPKDRPFVWSALYLRTEKFYFSGCCFVSHTIQRGIIIKKERKPDIDITIIMHVATKSISHKYFLINIVEDIHFRIEGLQQAASGNIIFVQQINEVYLNVFDKKENFDGISILKCV